MIAKLRGPAYPYRPDYENDLGKNEIKQTEFFLQDTTVLFNGSLEIGKWSRCSCFCVSSQNANGRTV